MPTAVEVRFSTTSVCCAHRVLSLNLWMRLVLLEDKSAMVCGRVGPSRCLARSPLQNGAYRYILSPLAHVQSLGVVTVSSASLGNQRRSERLLTPQPAAS